MQLSFHDVTFRYRRGLRDVLTGFTWTVPAGRTVLLGPNGAGKTTTLALGAGALRPTRGTVRLDPRPAEAAERELRTAVGWMPQTTRAIAGFRCLEQVAYAGWLKGLSKSAAGVAAKTALELVDLTDRADVKASELSGGQLRRLGLAQVLVHSPRVLLLDEPTADLDPAQRARFRQILFQATASLDSQVLVSTHQVDDLADSYDQVVLMRSGQILFQGTVSSFLATAAESLSPVAQAEAAYAKFVRED